MTLSLDGDGDLASQQSGEFNINLVVNTCLITPEVKRTKALTGCGQRNAANCLDGVIRYCFRKRKAIFQIDIVDNDRFLVFPNPTGHRTLDGSLSRCLPLCRNARFHEVASHYISFRVMKDNS